MVPSRESRLAEMQRGAAAMTGVPAAGLRARNKAQKMRKIRQAARELFVEKGYDDTTTRAIARRAGVGLGTLFTYAADKRDLLFLIFNDELEEVATAAFADIPAKSAFIDQLVHIFRAFYVFFARQPHLARFMLREQTFYTAGPEARRFQGHRERILLRLAKPIDAAKSRRQISSHEDSITIARAIFSIYAAEIRRWLGEEESEIELAAGLASLRRMLQLLITGLKPAESSTGRRKSVARATSPRPSPPRRGGARLAGGEMGRVTDLRSAGQGRRSHDT